MLWTIDIKKLDSQDEMEKLLERHKLSKLTQEEIQNMNTPILEIELVHNLKLPTKEIPDQDHFSD